MPSRPIHRRFDRILRNHGLIELSEHDCDHVHDRMDRDEMDYGSRRHHEDDRMHSEDGIYNWINNGRDSLLDRIRAVVPGRPTVYNVRLSDYLRVCLGHMVLDEYWTDYHMNSADKRERDIDEALNMAFLAYKRRGYDARRFRWSDSGRELPDE